MNCGRLIADPWVLMLIYPGSVMRMCWESTMVAAFNNSVMAATKMPGIICVFSACATVVGHVVPYIPCQSVCFEAPAVVAMSASRYKDCHFSSSRLGWVLLTRWETMLFPRLLGSCLCPENTTQQQYSSVVDRMIKIKVASIVRYSPVYSVPERIFLTPVHTQSNIRKAQE